MNAFIRAWSHWVVRARWIVIAAAVLLAGLALIPAQEIGYDNSNESYFVEGDPNLTAFNELLDLFGDVEYLSIGIEAPEGDPDVFTPETLGVIQALTRFLEDRPEVTQIRSLTQYEHTHSDGALIATDPLIDSIDDPEDLENAREIIQTESMALGTLITEDLQHTRIAARVRYEVGKSDNKMALMGAVRQFIEGQDFAGQGYSLRLSGQPVFTEQFEVLTKRDQRWINPTMAVIMILILFFSFRSVTGMLLPWAVIGTSIVYVSGLQGWLGWPHSVVESALIPALIIIGVGISVHVLVEFYHFRARGRHPRRPRLPPLNTSGRPPSTQL